MHIDWLIKNCNLVSFAQGTDGYGVVESATVAISDGQIIFAGSADNWTNCKDVKTTIDAQRKWMTPGLIDCHTHLVFSGNRAQEFEWRLQGESYERIAQKGGGIASTVKSTRKATKEELYAQSAKRLQRLLEEGVTTVEVKSGYGLDTETEIKMLEVAKALANNYPVTVKTTFLGAHAVPPEFKAKEDGQQAYIDYVCNEMLAAVAAAGLADAVDVFCESIGFTKAQCEQVFIAAKKHGLPIKGHVEQLSDLKGAVTAATHGALSVDHLEYLAERDVPSLENTVAVLLPAAFFCLKETQPPPIKALREHGIAMAVATDLNPGTAPMASLLTAINQACICFGLTPEEALKGATANAALALGIADKGRIQTGFDADLLLWDIDHPAELAYGVNFHRPTHVWQNGKLSVDKDDE